jgi:hypothetical protein
MLPVGLYKQLDRIHSRCQVRQFSDRETAEVVRLCVYAHLDQLHNDHINDLIETKY